MLCVIILFFNLSQLFLIIIYNGFIYYLSYSIWYIIIIILFYVKHHIYNGYGAI